MKRVNKSIASMVGAAVCALGTWALQPDLASAETETDERPVIVVPRAGGSAAYVKFGCVTCHLGDGRGGQNEGGYGADLRITKLSEQEIIQVVTFGREGKGMPSFKGMIDDETLGMLAKYIKDDLRLR